VLRNRERPGHELGRDADSAAVPLSRGHPRRRRDGTQEASDNCPGFANPTQSDTDADSRGDACDNCPSVANTNQSNQDGDALGDLCDPDRDGGRRAQRVGQLPTIRELGQQDFDGDAVGDLCDNCPYATNPTQQDTDNDGIGDAATRRPSEFPWRFETSSLTCGSSWVGGKTRRPPVWPRAAAVSDC